MDNKGGSYTIWDMPVEVHQNLVASLEDQYNHHGNGNKTSFWEDKWLGTTSSKSIFRDWHDMVVNNQVSIAEVWTQQGWNFQFRRNFNDWEIVIVTEFFRSWKFLQEQGMNMIYYGGAEIVEAHSR